MSVLRSHNNKTRGGLGRVCATGMYRHIEHVRFPKFQTGIFLEWKAPHGHYVSHTWRASFPLQTSCSFIALSEREDRKEVFGGNKNYGESQKKIYSFGRSCGLHTREKHLVFWSGMKSTPMNLLKGELLECLPDTEQPNDSTRIALAGIDRNNLRLECDTEGITKLTSEDANLLLAISSVVSRYQTFINRKRLDFGRQISPGSQVFVEVKGISKKLHGTVWYIGEVPPLHGTFFGVQLIVSIFLKYFNTLIKYS